MKPEEARVGLRVRFKNDPSTGLVPAAAGMITELRPQNGGVLVRPDGLDQSFGWGYEELLVEPFEPLRDEGPVEPLGPSVWEWLRNPAV